MVGIFLGVFLYSSLFESVVGLEAWFL